MFRNYSNYEIFDDGRIWSYRKNKFLKPQTDKDGYQVVCLYDNECKPKTYRVNRIIYESVSGEHIPSGMQVNHINECKTDNRFENLNLMTCKENINWGSGIERSAKSRTNGVMSKQVGAFQNGELVMVFQSTKEAHRNGFDSGHISACCRNCYSREGNNVYKGYTWKYINEKET